MSYSSVARAGALPSPLEKDTLPVPPPPLSPPGQSLRFPTDIDIPPTISDNLFQSRPIRPLPRRAVQREDTVIVLSPSSIPVGGGLQGEDRLPLSPRLNEEARVLNREGTLPLSPPSLKPEDTVPLSPPPSQSVRRALKRGDTLPLSPPSSKANPWALKRERTQWLSPPPSKTLKREDTLPLTPPPSQPVRSALQREGTPPLSPRTLKLQDEYMRTCADERANAPSMSRGPESVTAGDLITIRLIRPLPRRANAYMDVDTMSPTTVSTAPPMNSMTTQSPPAPSTRTARPLQRSTTFYGVQDFYPETPAARVQLPPLQTHQPRPIVREATKANFNAKLPATLDYIHLQRGSLHAKYESYVRTKVGEENVIFIPKGKYLLQQGPNRKLVLSTQNMLSFHAEYDAESKFNGCEDGMYVPLSSTLLQPCIPWTRQWKFMKKELYSEVTKNIPPEVVAENQKENAQDRTLTIRPLTQVTIVVEGRAKVLTVTPWSFHLLNSTKCEHQLTIDKLKRERPEEEEDEEFESRKRKRSKPNQRMRYRTKDVKNKTERSLPMRLVDVKRLRKEKWERMVREKEMWRRAHWRMMCRLRFRRTGICGRMLRPPRLSSLYSQVSAGTYRWIR